MQQLDFTRASASSRSRTGRLDCNQPVSEQLGQRLPCCALPGKKQQPLSAPRGHLRPTRPAACACFSATCP
eukprot:1543718-Pyramimonas_sp.AAC.1